jgi:hypothetical protein
LRISLLSESLLNISNQSITMVVINTPLSIWIQLMSFCFYSAGMFTDLLSIRLCLTAAYTFLLLNALLGSPLWPGIISPRHIQVDAIFWALLNLHVQITAVYFLLRDESGVDMNEDQEALWRLFYRTGGLSKKLFYRTIVNDMTLQRFEATEHIPMDKWFYIVYQGTVQLRVFDDKTVVSSRKAQSGEMLDFNDLNLFHDMEAFKNHQRRSEAHAITPVIVFRFPRDRMADIANHLDTKVIWQQLLMENLGIIAQRVIFDTNFKSHAMNKEYESPMFKPLQTWERPNPVVAGSAEALRTPLSHICASMVRSFAPPWPFGGPKVGLRHKLPAPRSRYRHVLRIPTNSMMTRQESKILASFRNISSSVHGEAWSEGEMTSSRHDWRKRKSSSGTATAAINDEDGKFDEYLKEKEEDEERAMPKDKKPMCETVHTEENSLTEMDTDL